MPQPIVSIRPKNDPNALALAALRIGVGIFFLIFGQYKVFGTQFTLHGGFHPGSTASSTRAALHSFMAPVLRNFVLPHATPIAFLVAYGEFAIGLALTFGILVQLPARLGA